MSDTPPDAPQEHGVPPTPGGSRYGSLARRFGARVIDGFLVGIPLGAVLVFGLGLDPQGAGYALLTSLVNLGYFVWLETAQGATVGKRLLGLAVTDETGGRITPEQSFKRNWWLLLGLVPFIGGLAGLGVAIYIAATISSDPRNQGFHDRMAGSLVPQR